MLLWGWVVCIGCNTSESIIMIRRPPSTETRTVLRTILSAGVLAVLVLACSGTAAAACPNDENMGTVNFRGVVTGEPVIDMFGTDGVNVQIDEILLDPTGNLTIGDVVTVGYPIAPPFADICVTVGDYVGVCGRYCGVEEPPDWSGVGDHLVWLHAPDHFCMRLDTLKFRGVVTGEPTINVVGADGVNVQIDEILFDPTGNLTIGDVVTGGYPIVPPFADIDAAVGDPVEVCGEYRDIGEIPDWWSEVGDHWVWLHAPDHFCMRLDTVKFRGVVTEEPVIDAVGADGVNVRIDEILFDPTGNLAIGNVVLVDYLPPFADIDAAVGRHVEVCGEYRDVEEPPDWPGVGNHWVWLHAPDHFYTLLPPTAAASSATGAPNDIYLDDEDVYVTGSGFTAGTDVDIFVVLCREWGWNDGDSIPSWGLVTVSGGTVSMNGDVGPVLVWHAPLVPDEYGIGYDIVIDANQNGVYDAATDGLDIGSPSFDIIIRMPSASVPALAPIGIITLVGLLCVIGMFRIRRRFD